MNKIDTLSGRLPFEDLRHRGTTITVPDSDNVRMVFLDDRALKVAFALHRSLGNAVKRNKIRRQMKAALAEINENMQIEPGAYLFKVKKNAMTCSYSELMDNLIQLLEKGDRLQKVIQKK